MYRGLFIFVTLSKARARSQRFLSQRRNSCFQDDAVSSAWLVCFRHVGLWLGIFDMFCHYMLSSGGLAGRFCPMVQLASATHMAAGGNLSRLRFGRLCICSFQPRSKVPPQDRRFWPPKQGSKSKASNQAAFIGLPCKWTCTAFFWPRQLTDRAILAIRQTQEKNYLEAVEANYLSYCNLWNTSFNLSYTQSAPYWKPSKKGGEGGREGGRCQLVFGFWRQLVFGSWFLVLGFWLVESQVKSSSELAKFAIETVFSGWFWHKLGYLVSLCQVATCQLPCQSLRACWWSTTLPRRFSTARPGRFGPRTATSVAQLELCQQHLQALERRHCCWERQFCQEHERQNGQLVPPRDNPGNFMFNAENLQKHQVTLEEFPELSQYQVVYAWEFSDALEYEEPKVQTVKKGCVTWMKLCAGS